MLVAQLDAVAKDHKGVVLAMNIYCNGTRTKNFKYDRINENSWKEWATTIASAQNEDDQKFSDIVRMKNQNVIGKLRAQQAKASRIRKINFFFKVLRVSMFAISVLISGLIYTRIKGYDKNDFTDLKHFCYAAKGDFFPH